MNAMNCEYVQERFSAYHERGLPQALAQTISLHLDSCPDCKKAYSEFAGIWQELGNLEDVAVPENLSQYIDARLNVHLLESKYERPLPWLRWLRNVAAAGAVTAALVIGFLQVGGSSAITASVLGHGAGPKITVVRVGTPMLSWSGHSPAITLMAQSDGNVEVRIQEGDQAPRTVDSFTIRKDSLVRLPIIMPLGGAKTLGRTMVLWVETESATSADKTAFVLPFGTNPSNFAVGTPLAALAQVAAHYGKPIAVHGALPQGEVRVDCSLPAAADALQRSPVFATWKLSEQSNVVTISRD
jgi:hypothetical protein